MYDSIVDSHTCIFTRQPFSKPRKMTLAITNGKRHMNHLHLINPISIVKESVIAFLWSIESPFSFAGICFFGFLIHKHAAHSSYYGCHTNNLFCKSFEGSEQHRPWTSNCGSQSNLLCDTSYRITGRGHEDGQYAEIWPWWIRPLYQGWESWSEGFQAVAWWRSWSRNEHRLTELISWDKGND